MGKALKKNQRLRLLEEHVAALKACSRCRRMIGPVVSGIPVLSPVMLIGQAPGVKEGEFARPFAWTAGKTLFRWFESIGLAEEEFRNQVYMAAVCRCFPGKNPKGGDRVPDKTEVENCSLWLKGEFELLQPQLVISVGKLAIEQLLKFDKLVNVVGKAHVAQASGLQFDIIPLPHPSGASTWHRMEPGKSLLQKALRLIKRHPAYKQLL